MKMKKIHVESVQDIDATEVTIKNIFTENIMTAQDENTTKIKKITVESIIDYPMNQSV